MFEITIESVKEYIENELEMARYSVSARTPDDAYFCAFGVINFALDRLNDYEEAEELSAWWEEVEQPKFRQACRW